jgi:cob(I)alamin adenosyltransferase
MKIYTRTGDDGSSSDRSGRRLPKNHPLLEAIGTVDEVNGALGLAAAACNDTSMSRLISQLQCWLFDLGADLALGAEPKQQAGHRLGDAQVRQMERWIDDLMGHLPPLKQFILPGGSELASRLHVARTLCRRAERAIVAIGEDAAPPPEVLAVINRLSDLLFVMARRANQVAGVADVPWQSQPSDDGSA